MSRSEPLQKKFFLSYNHEDKSLAEKIASIIKKAGHQVWRDDEIKVSEEFTDAILKAIECVDAAIIVRTQRDTTKYLKAEWSVCRKRCIEEQMRIVPVLTPGAVPYDEYMAGIQSIQLDSYEISDKDAGNIENKLRAMDSCAPGEVDSAVIRVSVELDVEDDVSRQLTQMANIKNTISRLGDGMDARSQVLGLNVSASINAGDLASTIVNIKTGKLQTDGVRDIEISPFAINTFLRENPSFSQKQIRSYMKVEHRTPAGVELERKQLNEIFTLIGRDPRCDIHFAEHAVSRFHCVILHDQGLFYVLDLNSLAGTKVGGRKIQLLKELKTCDTLQLGPVKLQFIDETNRSPTEDSAHRDSEHFTKSLCLSVPPVFTDDQISPDVYSTFAEFVTEIFSGGYPAELLDQPVQAPNVAKFIASRLLETIPKIGAPKPIGVFIVPGFANSPDDYVAMRCSYHSGLRPSKTATEHVMRTNSGVMYTSVNDDHEFPPQSIASIDIKTAVAVPLVGRDQCLDGVLQ
ncbi:MAG: TIR domain-containing protein, partial [Planctomycetota bacterium]